MQDRRIITAKEQLEWREKERKHNKLVYSGMVTDLWKKYRPRRVAYTIDDPYVGKVDIYETANAWWADRIKVLKVIESLKAGNSVKLTRNHAGINEIQWKYFRKVHPHFPEIQERLESLQIIKALDVLNGHIHDPKIAMFITKNKNPQFKTKKTLHDLEPNAGDILPEDYDHEEAVESWDEAAEAYMNEWLQADPQRRIAYENYQIINSGIQN